MNIVLETMKVEAGILATLSRLTAEDVANHLGFAVTTPWVLSAALEGMQERGEVSISAVEDLPFGQELVSVLEIAQEEKEVSNLLASQELSINSAERRALYLPSIQLTVSELVSKPGFDKVRYQDDIKPAGLLARIVEDITGKAPTNPVCLEVHNCLPNIIDENDKDTGIQWPMDSAHYRTVFKDQGYLWCEDKMVWNIGEGVHQHPVTKENLVKKYFQAALGKAIDWLSYHRRHRAPLEPGGFIKVNSVNVQLTGLGSDGAGFYDPKHPDTAHLMGRACQGTICVIQEDEEHQWKVFMFKGVWVPREGLNDKLPEGEQSAFWPDREQVKGTQKKAVHAVVDAAGRCHLAGKGYVGLLRVKRSWGRVSACFQNLQFVGPTRGSDFVSYVQNKRIVKGLLEKKVSKAIAKLSAEGSDGLVAHAVKSDPNLKEVYELVSKVNAKLPEEHRINPLSMEMFKGKVEDSLARRLWKIAQGGGIRGRYPITLVDKELAAGECVVSGYKPGSKLAAWRNPMISAQGLVVLEVIRASNRHRVDGKTVPYVIYMSPRDLITKMQGDDDGDEVGITDDEDVIALWEQRITNRVYHFEPDGEKMDDMALSTAGRKYMQTDPKGPVGQCTIMQAQLLAVGDNHGAMAMAVMIQECLDAAKNKVRWSDIYRAADLRNWHVDENEEVHIHYKDENGDWLTKNFLSKSKYEDAPQYPQGFPMDRIETFLNQRLARFKCYRGGEVWMYPLGWRRQETLSGKKLHKKIAVDNWIPAGNKQGGYKGGNWVHLAHDLAMEAYHKISAALLKGVDELRDSHLIYKLLEARGVHLSPPTTPYSEYEAGLRVKAGLTGYGKQMRRTMGNSAISREQASNELAMHGRLFNDILSRCSVEELAEIWYRESTEMWRWNIKGTYYYSKTQPKGQKARQVNKPKYGFRILTLANSALLEAIGVEVEGDCKYFLPTKEEVASNQPIRADRVAAYTLRQENPYRFLGQLLYCDTGHSKHIKDENGASTPLHACECCKKALTDRVIRLYRKSRTAKEAKEVKALVRKMSTNEHQFIVETFEDFDNYEDMSED